MNRKLVKHFRFHEEERSRITLGVSTRLNPETHRIQLKAGVDGFFPLGPNLVVRTWTANPKSSRGWLGFESIVHHKYIGGVRVTQDRYRLSDGVNEWWWNGTAWTINTVNWNTEGEVADNISTFTNVARKIGVVINIQTEDKRETPEIEEVKVLYASDVEFQEDLIFRSLVPSLKESIRPAGDFPVKMAATSNTLNIKTGTPLETPYDVVSIDGVFNHTDDPNHDVNLFSAYNAGTGAITLTTTIASGKTAWIRFRYRPMIAVQTGRDFNEVDRVPALILEEVFIPKMTEVPFDDYVRNKSSGTAVIVPAPNQGDIEIRLVGLTDKSTDQHRLADEVKRYFGNHPFLRSKALDEDYRLWLVDEYDMRSGSDRADMNRGSCVFRIVNALFFSRDAFDGNVVHRFNMRFTEEVATVGMKPVFWGVGAAGGNSSGFISGLANTALLPNRAFTFVDSPEASEKLYWCQPVLYGTPTFAMDGIDGGFFLRATVSFTHAGGTENYAIWESDNLGLGTTEITVR